MTFSMEERRNQCTHNFKQISALIFIITEVDTYLNGQSNFTYFHMFASLLNMGINRCQGRVKFQSSPSTQMCFYY